MSYYLIGAAIMLLLGISIVLTSVFRRPPGKFLDVLKTDNKTKAFFGSGIAAMFVGIILLVLHFRVPT